MLEHKKAVIIITVCVVLAIAAIIGTCVALHYRARGQHSHNLAQISALAHQQQRYEPHPLQQAAAQQAAAQQPSCAQQQQQQQAFNSAFGFERVRAC